MSTATELINDEKANNLEGDLEGYSIHTITPGVSGQDTMFECL